LFSPVVKTGTFTFPARGQFLEFWRKGVFKVTFLIIRLFTNVLEQWLKRYLFITDENNCSCAVESEADCMSMCSKPLSKGGSAANPEYKCSRKAQKGDFAAEKVSFQRTQHLFEFRG
jgi:hypothetical protein